MTSSGSTRMVRKGGKRPIVRVRAGGGSHAAEPNVITKSLAARAALPPEVIGELTRDSDGNVFATLCRSLNMSRAAFHRVLGHRPDIATEEALGAFDSLNMPLARHVVDGWRTEGSLQRD